MSLTLEQIMVETRKLPREQIAELVDRLSVELIDPKVEEAWMREAIRRLEEIETGQSKPIPGEEVMKRARKTIGR
jgi:putative addiction module component (TIGR02574 family)